MSGPERRSAPTVCTHDTDIRRGGALLHPSVELSDVGQIVSEQWFELKNRYPRIELDQFIVMPNHIHGIIIINAEQAEQSPAPTTECTRCTNTRAEQSPAPTTECNRGTDTRAEQSPTPTTECTRGTDTQVEQSPAPTIGAIICAYKSITTRLANKKHNAPGRIIWQRNYYDHVIRDESDLLNIRQYIQDNPFKWEEDKYYF